MRAMPALVALLAFAHSLTVARVLLARFASIALDRPN
jgi:hypothetical protein